ncbi:MAG: hypothetical protein OEX12_05310 [Gammaproteobacteria bacterium]|nr:hypothetical protein [Gammaproteobacteria bacterium]
MENIKIQYIFKLSDSSQSEFILNIDADSLEIVKDTEEALPAWTELEYQQCPHCPLDPTSVSHCPTAVCLSKVIDTFSDVISYEEVELEVITDNRKISQHTSAQKSISSLLGLMFATSGCPHTNFFKPMARFHLPLSSPEETVFRASSMYLLSQYFIKKSGNQAELELDGLKDIYTNLHKLNVSISKRISAASTADSTKNAIVILDMLTNYLPIVIEDHLESIQHLFKSYTKDEF